MHKHKNHRAIPAMFAQKISFTILSFFLLLIGTVYAVGMGTPGGQTPGGTFSPRLTNISGTCPMSGPDNTFLKGFDADYKKICVLPAGGTPLAFSPTSPVSYPSTQPSGELPQGKFGTYFNNFRGTCSSTDVIKGFTTQGQKICTNTSVPSLAPKGAASISWPNNSGGQFQSFFNNMFINTCGANEAIIGFASNGTQICAPFRINGVCNSSVKFGCLVGASQSNDTGPCDGSATWTCSGKNGGNSISCSKANDSALCRFVTTTYTSSARDGTTTVGVGTHKRCVITGVWGDAWDYTYYNVIGSENSNWSFKISDEGSKHSAYGSILCTKEVASGGSPTEGASCVYGGISGIKQGGICYVGSYFYAPGGTNMSAH